MAQQKHEPVNSPDAPVNRVPTAIRPQEWGWSGMAGYEVLQETPDDPLDTKYRVEVTGQGISYDVSASGFVDAAEKGARRYVIAQKDLFGTRSVSVTVTEYKASRILCAKAYDVIVTSIKLSIQVDVVAVRDRTGEEW